ncbi:MAG: lipopolysaccharide biosynthesis protein [Candidatus Latescibacteria bacterium]|nr:lipopolysaccharide biosynthesis protein [Candidatus Latescibacterota bacterium]
MPAEKALATQAIHGVFWTTGATLIQLLTPLILYAFLPKEELGLFETALTTVMLLALIGDLGLSSALVQSRQVEEVHFDTAFWANLAFGIALTALIFLSAPLVCALQAPESPEAFWHIYVPLSLLIPFASVSGIFRSRLQRELDFRHQALAEVVSILFFLFTVILLLWASGGIWSAVIGSVVREVALLASLAVSAAWRPRFSFSRVALREILPYSLHLTGSRALNYLSSNLPRFLLTRYLGATAMAYYSFASRLTLIPLTRLSTIITRVSFPTFAVIQDDDDLLRRGYLKAVQSIALFSWPALLGVFAFAPEVLLQVPGMTPARGVLRLLVVATLFKAVGVVVGSIFMAKGKANWSLYWSLFNLAVLIPAMYWTLPYDIEGVSAAIALTSLLFLVLSQHYANQLIDLRFTAFLAALGRPLLVSLPVVAALVGVKFFLPASPLPALVLGGVLGAGAYVLGLRLFAWELCRQYWRGFRGRSAAGPASA